MDNHKVGRFFETQCTIKSKGNPYSKSAFGLELIAAKGLQVT